LSWKSFEYVYCVCDYSILFFCFWLYLLQWRDETCRHLDLSKLVCIFCCSIMATSDGTKMPLKGDKEKVDMRV